jgi:predicted RNA-binding protein YlqC (UPF0109 family)
MVKELVEFVVKQFVNNPQDVSVVITPQGNCDLIEIKVNDADRGKVIGREGQTIKAIRMLVNAATPADKKYSVDIAK